MSFPALPCIRLTLLLPLLMSAALLAPPASAQDEPKPARSFWEQLRDGVRQGVEQATGGDLAGKIGSGVRDGLEGKVPQRIGYVPLGNGRYLTYFDGDLRGFPSSGRPLAAKPAPGAPGASVPVMVTVPTNVRDGKSYEGALVANNIEEMKKHGFLVAFPPDGLAPFAQGTERAPTGPATVVVQEANEADGRIVRNHPNNCRIIVVYDAGGNALGQRSLRSDLDFNLAAVCETKTSEMLRKGIRDASPAAPR